MRKIPLSLIIFKFFYIFGWYFKKQNEMTWQLRFANILDILEKSEEESIDFKYTKEQQTKYHPFTSLNNSRHYINNTNKGDVFFCKDHIEKFRAKQTKSLSFRSQYVLLKRGLQNRRAK